jgi:hypothetical protein
MKRYIVGTMREAGLEAKWGKMRSGGPIILVRDPNSKHKHQRETWWAVTGDMWQTMLKTNIKEGFDSHTLLGDIFSVKA